MLRLMEKSFSHSTRKPNYRRIELYEHNRIVKIDCAKKIAYVEPNVPMDLLVSTLLEKGLMATVIPEFKGITVAGAISGAALESSSHLYGQFNDQCIAYEIQLGNGERVRTSKEINPDLFYGVSGAYGSLGMITLIEIQLIESKPWVKLQKHRLNSVQECIKLISELHNKVDFIEGFIFGPNECYVIEGQLITDEESQSIQEIFTLSFWKPWFFQQIRKTKSSTFKMTIEDYLFRHDQGAFWMGSYGQYYSLFFRYYLESRWGLSSKVLDYKKYAVLKEPGLFFSIFFGSWMTSRKLYRMIHQRSEEWFSKRFIVQDYYIPVDQCVKFIEKVNQDAGVFPLWLCPVKSTQTPQFFSPHFNEEEDLLVDVGVYGMPSKTSEVRDLNRYLEQVTAELGGRKMLYSYNEYNQEEFWKIYPKHTYEELRKKYGSEKGLSIEEKVLKI